MKQVKTSSSPDDQSFSAKAPTSLFLSLQHSACAPKQPQEHELCLLQARVAGNGVQHKLLHFLGVVWPLPKHMLQQQAVILDDLRVNSQPSAWHTLQQHLFSLTCEVIKPPQLSMKDSKP